MLTRSARGYLIAVLSIAAVTCRLGDLIGTPRAGLLVLPDTMMKDSAAVGSAARRVIKIPVKNGGDGTFEWTARVAGGNTWITLPDPSGSAGDTLVALMDPAGLDTSVYRDSITVTPTGSTGALTVPVRFTIYPCVVSTMGVNSQKQGTLTSADCGAPHRPPGHFAQVWEFNGAANDLLTIEVTAGFDGFVVIDTSLDSAVPPLDSSDNCLGASPNPCLPYVPLPRGGPYWVEVTTSAPADSGPYTLRVMQPRSPNAPDSLSQRLTDSTTIVPRGEQIAQMSLLLRAVVSDADPGDVLHLEAEVRPSGTPFSGPTASGPPVANGKPAWVLISGLSDNTAYHWQLRVVDNTRADPGPWKPFGGPTDFSVNVPQAPNNPTVLSQFQVDSTTPIGIGGTATTDTVYLGATINDPDPGDLLRLQVEIQPIATAFTNTPTDSSVQVVAGGGTFVKIRSHQLANNTSYHWQARAIDKTGRVSAWTCLCGNPDFRVAIAHPPLPPSNLLQFQSDGTTPIAVGGTANQRSVVLKGTVSDPDGQQVRLEVEVQPVGTDFTNTATAASTNVASGAQATVTVSGLTDGADYHWQARAVDAGNLPGPWLSFGGGNPETAPDFHVTGTVAQLVFTVQPTVDTAGRPIRPAPTGPQVTARDANGNTVTSFNGLVTMSIVNNPGSDTLSGTKAVLAVAGVANFPNLIIRKTGTGYTLQASTGVVSSAASSAFNVVSAPPIKLAFTVQPTQTVAGAAMSPAVVVAAQDSINNTATSFTGGVTLTIAFNAGNPPGTLTGGGPVTAGSGIATFPNLRIDKSGVGYTLQAAATGLTPATSAAFTIIAGPATHLAFTVPPGGAAANAIFVPPVEVSGLDVNNNLATSFVGTVTVAIGTNPPGNGILSGTKNVAAVTGKATFSDLSIDKTGIGYTLTASATGLTGATSPPFTITNSPVDPARSTVVASPATITACQTGCSVGASTASTITVTARDNGNNPVAGVGATISVTGSGNNIVPIGTVTTNASGVATWTLNSTVASATPAELKIISAVINSQSITQKDTVTVNPAAAASLVFTTQPPASTTAGVAMAPAVVVTARDQFLNTATSFTSAVTMAIVTNPGADTISGTKTVNASAGVATFSNLRIRKAANGYTLQASSTVPALTSPQSTAFNIVSAPKAQVTFTTQPTTTAVLARIDSVVGGVVVTIQDSIGNRVTNATDNVTVALFNNPTGAILGGTNTKAAIGGLATFNDLTLDKLGTGYTLIANATGLATEVSAGFDVIPGPAKSLTFAVNPTQTVAGQIISPAVQVTARDIQGNVATGFAGTVTVAIGTNPPGNGILTGTLSVAAVAGTATATFSDLSIDKAGTGYTLTASTPALPTGPVANGTSNSFNIVPGGVSPTLSTVSASPTTITASSGASVSTITVTARDGLGNPIAGATVTLSATGTGNTLTQPATTTNALGVATGTLSSMVAESKIVSATITLSPNPPVSVTQTATITVSPAAASVLLFTLQPTNTVAGAVIRPATGVQVEVRDAFGNRVTTASNSVGVSILVPPSPPGGVLDGLTPKTPVGGVITFSDLNIDKAGTGYQLLASATGLISDTSSAFNITVGAANKLAFIQQPTNANGGATITPAVTVAIQDSVGNQTTSTSNVTLVIGNNAGPGAQLTGGGPFAAVSGLATFSGLKIDSAGVGYTLVASSGTLTQATSGAFTISVGPAAKVGFLGQPTSTSAGTTITPAVTVEIRDLGGNRVPVSNSVGLSILVPPSPGGATLTGGTAIPAVSGLATFNALSIDKVGTGYELLASSTGLTPDTSAAFDISAGAASKLAISTQPSPTAQSGVAFTQQPMIQIQDASGNPVSQSGTLVTASVATGPGGATLSNPTATTNSSGVASFSGLAINGLVGSYTLTFSATGLTSVTSGTITLSAGPAAKLGITTPPSSSAQSGVAFGQQPVIQVQDASGNPVSQNGTLVTAVVASGPGGATLSNATATTIADGSATFGGLAINGLVGSYTLRFNATGLSSVTTGTITLSAGLAAKLAITTPPSTSAQSGVAFGQQPVIQIQDLSGNAVSQSGTLVTAGIASGPGGATLSNPTATTIGNGSATFSGLAINGLVGSYTLTFSAPSLTSVTSGTITLSAGPAAKLTFTNQPTTTTAGATINASGGVQVRIEDLAGNVVSNPRRDITIAIGNNPGNDILSGTLTKLSAPGSGISTFSDLSIDSAGVGYTLVASATGLTNGTSNPFSIVPGAVSASMSTVSASPTTIQATTGSSTITVTAKDALGNRIQGATVVLSATGTGNTLTQPGGTTDGSGVATGTLSSTDAEDKVVSATINGVAITPTATVTVTP